MPPYWLVNLRFLESQWGGLYKDYRQKSSHLNKHSFRLNSPKRSGNNNSPLVFDELDAARCMNIGWFPKRFQPQPLFHTD